jgi:hypothetical protein
MHLEKLAQVVADRGVVVHQKDLHRLRIGVRGPGVYEAVPASDSYVNYCDVC